MKFTITHQRASVGNDIDLQVEAENVESIVKVNCQLDDSPIGTDDFTDTPVVSFQRTFNQVGEARSGKTHRFLVEVQDKSDGTSKFASKVWTDPI